MASSSFCAKIVINYGSWLEVRLVLGLGLADKYCGADRPIAADRPVHRLVTMTVDSPPLLLC